MFKRFFKPFRLKLLPDLPRGVHRRRDPGIEPRNRRDAFLARRNPNLGGWV